MSPEMSLNYVCVCEEARLSKKPTQVQGEHGSANGHAADSTCGPTDTEAFYSLFRPQSTGMNVRPTIKEFNDVGEVHVVVHDDLTVNCDQRQGQEEDKVLRGNPGSHPDHLPHRKHVVVQQLCTQHIPVICISKERFSTCTLCLRSENRNVRGGWRVHLS